LNNPNFVFTDKAPWSIDYTKRTFEIDQEISRINEIGFKSIGGYLDKNENFAAAIAIPDWVPNAQFNGMVSTSTVPNVNPPPGIAYRNISNIVKVKYEDYSSFSITTADGTVYIFGRALRGQKFLVNDKPYWSTLSGGSNPNDAGDVAAII